MASQPMCAEITVPQTISPGDRFFAFAPASIANVGPCYDIMGYALDHLGDVAELVVTDKAGHLEWGGCLGVAADQLYGVTEGSNAAYVVAEHIWSRHAVPRNPGFGVSLRLHKRMPVGSGLGSSAASGVAAAKVLLEVLSSQLGLQLDSTDIANALVQGERVTAGTPHPDNVVPSYFGGFFLMCVSRANALALDAPIGDAILERLDAPDDLITVVVKPNVSVATADARQAVRDYVVQNYIKRSDVEAVSRIMGLVRDQSALAARMIYAVMRGDVKTIGEIVHENPLLEASRGRLIPNLSSVKASAIDAGAYGCSIAGSGPSMLAITDSDANAREIRDAMILAFDDDHCRWLISRVSKTGARLISADDLASATGGEDHNFF